MMKQLGNKSKKRKKIGKIKKEYSTWNGIVLFVLLNEASNDESMTTRGIYIDR